MSEEVSEFRTRRDDTLKFSSLKPQKGGKMLSIALFLAHFGGEFATLSELSIVMS